MVNLNGLPNHIPSWELMDQRSLLGDSEKDDLIWWTLQGFLFLSFRECAGLPLSKYTRSTI